MKKLFALLPVLFIGMDSLSRDLEIRNNTSHKVLVDVVWDKICPSDQKMLEPKGTMSGEVDISRWGLFGLTTCFNHTISARIDKVVEKRICHPEHYAHDYGSRSDCSGSIEKLHVTEPSYPPSVHGGINKKKVYQINETEITVVQDD